jgi:hypothetical protein
MAWWDLDLGGLDLGGGGASDWWGGGGGGFNLSFPQGGNWWDSSQFSLPSGIGAGDPQTGWPTASFPSDGGGGGGDWWNTLTSKLPDLSTLAKGGEVLKNFADPAFGVMRVMQNNDYNKQLQDWYKAQKDYLAKKQQWESDFMGQFQQSKEEFGAANEEFQGQLGEASGQAQEVLNQYLAAAKPLLAQSQDLIVPAIAALTKGEVPEALQPVLNEAKQRATAQAMQSMISAGMSPEDARASVQPMVDQLAHKMLLDTAVQMSGQGLALGGQGMQGLQGAGMMTDIMGRLAAMGMNPMSQEFMAMMNVMGHILGGSQIGPPPAPVK